MERQRLLLCCIVVWGALISADASPASDAFPSKISVCELRSHPDKYDGKLVQVRGELIAFERHRAISDRSCPDLCVHLSTKYGDVPKDRSEYNNRDDWVRDLIIYQDSAFASITSKVVATYTGIYRLKKLGSTRPLRGNLLIIKSISQIIASERREGMPGYDQQLYCPDENYPMFHPPEDLR